MRRLDQNYQVDEIICNQCGKRIKVVNGIIKEGCFEGNISWGYFSNQDGKHDSFELCEECYQKMIDTFKIPVTRVEEKELL